MVPKCDIADARVADWNSFSDTGKLPRGGESDLKSLGSASHCHNVLSRAKSFHINLVTIGWGLAQRHKPLPGKHKVQSLV